MQARVSLGTEPPLMLSISGGGWVQPIGPFDISAVGANVLVVLGRANYGGTPAYSAFPVRFHIPAKDDWSAVWAAHEMRMHVAGTCSRCHAKDADEYYSVLHNLESYLMPPPDNWYHSPTTTDKRTDPRSLH